MKILLLLLVVLVALLMAPVGHGAHRRAPGAGQQAPHQPRHLIRVLRTPQAPKVVRAVR